MWRRVTLGCALAFALSLSIEAPEARRIHSRIGQAPPEPPLNFIENTTVQTLATDGYCTGAHTVTSEIDAGEHKIWVAWMTNAGGCATGSHTTKIVEYSYLTGVWTSPVTLATKDPVSSDHHDSPSLTLNVDGKIEVYYGGVSCGQGTPTVDGPCYRVSTNSHSISSFAAEQKVQNIQGSFSEIRCRPQGSVMHCFGQHQHSGGIFASFNLDYARRVAGTWQAAGPAAGSTHGEGHLVRDGNGNPAPGSPAVQSGIQGDPGCVPGTFVNSVALQVVWTRSGNGTTGFSACSGVYRDLYFIQSTDGGDTWTDSAGGNSFARTAGLLGTFDSGLNVYTYPTAYRVFNGTVATGWATTRTSAGVPIVVFQTSSGLQYRKYTGGSWNGGVINASCTGHQGAAVVVNGSDHILAYCSAGADGAGNVVENKSTDGGSSWTPTTIHTKGTEPKNQYFTAIYRPSLGGKDRVLVTWIQTVSGGASTKLAFRDRPQS